MNADADAVRDANTRFYRARSAQNLLEMEAVWSHAPHVCCVHPGETVLQGWDRIRDSWRTVLGGALCLTVEPEAEQVTIVGPAAIVTCRERITSFTLDGSMQAARQATNIFQKRRGRWSLIVHHASPLEPH
jgi:ketosteroid isomerase-like protein